MSVVLDAQDAWRLAAAQVADVRPGPGPLWSVRAGRKVGAARIGGVELYIEPKVPVARLLFLLGYARNPHRWQDDTVALAAEQGLVPAVASALWRQTDRALRRGLLQGYRTLDAVSSVLRGRLRETAQLSRRLAAPVPLEVCYDEYTVDVAENRILASAVERMLRVPGVDAESRRMLRHLAARFPGVTRLPLGTPVPAWQPTRLNAHLRTALHLAELVLAGVSVEAGRGTVVANAFLLDMWQVYEDFLAVALRSAIERVHGGSVRWQDRHHLDHGQRLELRPDILWRDPTGQFAAVVDAKYKVGEAHGDTYQMLAYCVAYGLPRGHLVYVSGDRPSTRHVVRNAGVEICCHSLDLGMPPSELLDRIAALAHEVVSRTVEAGVEPFESSAP
ncbi:McrC family protein [Micromonospora psammae]|uniref:McrC family protein n=1 Tax=Micromonospora sp. CPCC 205556 TaxID=3122398 RepID=UPI002FF3991A